MLLYVRNREQAEQTTDGKGWVGEVEKRLTRKKMLKKKEESYLGSREVVHVGAGHLHSSTATTCR